ncbi:MAG: substrate-binding domain-containing protein [Candidatus Puniceispirillaceae bacterium]
MIYRLLLILFLTIYLPISGTKADILLLQSTTSTLNSGLYDYLLPSFTKDTGIKVHVVAVGTGKALANARHCNGDALLIHSTKDEITFVSSGFGLYRHDVMYNDFVLVGPFDDPIGLSAYDTAAEAFGAIAQNRALFASRSDDSGTHKTEMRLWHDAGFDPVPHSGDWYLETGSGMGATLNLAVEKKAYSLTDRATWLAFANKQEHRILFEGDKRLFNQYGVIPISKKACPKTNEAAAILFADWLISDRGQALIAGYQKAGNQLFTPNAR